MSRSDHNKSRKPAAYRVKRKMMQKAERAEVHQKIKMGDFEGARYPTHRMVATCPYGCCI